MSEFVNSDIIHLLAGDLKILFGTYAEIYFWREPQGFIFLC